MSEIKPTPGPWCVLGDDELSGIKFIEISRGDFGPDYRPIAWVGNQPDGISDEDRANANLVAAAPEMLVALKAVEWAGLTDDGHGGYEDACPSCGQAQRHGHDQECMLAAAIAKAEGWS